MNAEPRPLDHLVLPTASLETARARLTALGFTVAPVGVHPFGTANACVFLADGTYLEPLAVADERQAREAARQGNAFVARDAAYRYRQGGDGFSALVFGTQDARDDDLTFRREGMSGGEILDFSRPFTDAAGNTGEASFRLAFAADLRAPDIFFFTCQRIGVPKVDRASLQSHRNGVTGIVRVVLSASRPFDFAPIVSMAADAPPVEPAAGQAVRVAARNMVVDLVDDAGLEERYGLDAAGHTGLQARAVCFAATDLARIAGLLGDAGISYHMKDSRLVVPPASGQGAAFVFEEIS
ncbi:VOC family protein [Mesorhizobium sp. ASY16-5R]|uniref:VOC family protein n=1 Tax=Mesorhizobium sp. ASY16-5R TaxID=3445772 RepID=UPI003FA04983